jgi:hypothetical protein
MFKKENLRLFKNIKIIIILNWEQLIDKMVKYVELFFTKMIYCYYNIRKSRYI